jgi:hypothetical protein
LPQASESAAQYLSHPQQIRWGFLGEIGNFLDTGARQGDRSQGYTRAQTGRHRPTTASNFPQPRRRNLG